MKLFGIEVWLKVRTVSVGQLPPGKSLEWCASVPFRQDHPTTQPHQETHTNKNKQRKRKHISSTLLSHLEPLYHAKKTRMRCFWCDIHFHVWSLPTLLPSLLPPLLLMLLAPVAAAAAVSPPSPPLPRALLPPPHPHLSDTSNKLLAYWSPIIATVGLVSGKV